MKARGRTIWRWSGGKQVIRKLGVVVLALAAGITPALAEGGSMAANWQTGFQEAVTPVMERTDAFHDFLLYVVAGISGFVLALLLICVFRFNARVNPVPSKRSHNTPLEVAWTLIPILILVVIAIPSFRLLFYQEVLPEADMTLKVTGHQWYWEYEYPDHDDFFFDSIMLEEDELKPGQLRLLSVDNPLVVPVDTTVRVQITSSDVLYSWAMPAFGVKMDAVPGRLNETWFRATQTGVYYGQCSELCGSRHAFMPIEVHVVERARYEGWLERAKQEFASRGPATAPGHVARAMPVTDAAPRAVSYQ